jgi:alcohol dehydrogenase class IV
MCRLPLPVWPTLPPPWGIHQGLTAEAGAKACLVAIRKLAADIGIPASLSELGVKREDIPLLARNALKTPAA